MSFPKYPAYKRSGVQWLGDLPDDWNVSRLGFEAWVRARLGWKGLKAEEYVDDGYPMLATPNIKGKCIDFDAANKINEFRFDESPEIKLRLGDVLLAKDGSTLGTVNVVRSLPRPATVNSSIAVITPRASLDGLFLGYLFLSSFMMNMIASLKGGMGVPHLFQEDLNKFYLPLPPLVQQRAITAFLDREAAKIDSLVDKQNHLIELLKEKRKAVISRAVTKGLNPNVPMKDSEVEWLGHVPSHWSVSQLRRLLRGDVINGIFKKKDEFGSGALLVNVFDAYRRDFCVEFASLDRVCCTSAELEAYRVQPGDLLFVRSSLKQEGIAVVVLVGRHDEPAVFECHLIRARPKPSVLHARYASYVLGSDVYRGQMISSAKMTTMTTIDQEAIKSIAMVSPPLSEQVDIALYLDNQVSKLDQLIDQASAATNLLLERRSALISSAVTGKIDVRGLVPKPEAVAA